MKDKSKFQSNGLRSAFWYAWLSCSCSLPAGAYKTVYGNWKEKVSSPRFDPLPLLFPGQHQRGRGSTVPGREHLGERQRFAVRGEQRRPDQIGPGHCACWEQVGLLLTPSLLTPASGLPVAESALFPPARGTQLSAAASQRNIKKFFLGWSSKLRDVLLAALMPIWPAHPSVSLSP